MSHFDALAALASLHTLPPAPAHVGADATSAAAEPLSTSTIVGFTLAALAIPMSILIIQKGAQDDAEKLVHKEAVGQQLANKERAIQQMLLEREASKRASESFYPGLSEWNGEV